jgi:hypothetical protein
VTSVRRMVPTLQRRLMLVLYYQGHWKIADFGLTSEATSNRLVTSISARGKPCYRAPELLGEPSGYNNKTDVWSLGCIGYELFTGQKAFRDDFHVFQYSTSRNPPKEVIQQLTPIGQYYVQDLLEIDPAKRPSAKLLLLGKFGTDWNSTALKAAVEVPSRRSSLPDLTPLGGPSKLLGNTLCWAGFNQAVHPEFFETLLQVINVTSAAGTVTLEHNRQEQADSEFSPADRVFMALKVALLAGAFGYLGRLLRQTPDGNEKDAASIERYVYLWETHTDVVKGLGERGMLIHRNDYMNKEALFRLATKSSTEIAEAISRIIPGDMKIVGDDWAAILSPSDPSQDLSISLIRRFMFRSEYSSLKTRFSCDGKYIAVCYEIKKPQPNDLIEVQVMIFDIDSAREVARIGDVIHKSLANFAILDLSPGFWNITFVLSSGDIVINDGRCRQGFASPGGGPSCFELSQDGTVLVWGSDDNSVGLRECFSGQRLEYWTVKDCPAHSVAVSSDNKLVAATGANGLYVWNRASPNRSFYCERSCVRTSAPLFCNTSNAVFVGSGEGTIDCWETDSDTPLATRKSLDGFPGSSIAGSTLAINSTGKWLGYRYDGSLHFVSIDAKSQFLLFNSSGNPCAHLYETWLMFSVDKLIFSPTIPGMFATLDEGHFRVWRLKGIK